MKRYSIIAIVLLIGCIAIAAPDTLEMSDGNNGVVVTAEWSVIVSGYNDQFWMLTEEPEVEYFDNMYVITDEDALIWNNITVTNMTLFQIQYNKGFNDAIEAIMLLDLELDLKGERKTWAEMGDIIRKRWNVKPREISKTEHEE